MDFSSDNWDQCWEDALIHGNTPTDFSGRVLPILFCIRQWGVGSWRKKREITEHLIRTIRQELLCEDPAGGCVRLDETHILFVYTREHDRETMWQTIRQTMEHCMLICDISCIVGKLVEARDLGAMVDSLCEIGEKSVSSEPILMPNSVYNCVGIPQELLDQGSYLLQDERFDQLLILMSDYFFQHQQDLDSDSLYRFNQDFIQMLYSVMKEKQIPAHVLFQKRENAERFREADASVGNTVSWIFFAVTEMSTYLEQRRRSENYIEQAKRYILSHLSSAFTRQEIADHVHLSQNHLARLFRQETGMSISDYILQERMKMAFGLLKKTTLPVGEVALRSGYENYSYFLTLFRRVAGMTPSQYREKYSEQTSMGGAEHHE